MSNVQIGSLVLLVLFITIAGLLSTFDSKLALFCSGWISGYSFIFMLTFLLGGMDGRDKTTEDA